MRASTLIACAPIPARPPLRAFFDALVIISLKLGAGFFDKGYLTGILPVEKKIFTICIISRYIKIINTF
jgi:hypothetical protein